MKNVLFVAGIDQRYYYDAFAEACVRKGLAVYLLDPSQDPRKVGIDMTLEDSGAIAGTIKVNRYEENDLVETQLSISDIDIAWYLRESGTESVEEEPLEIRFAKEESRRALFSFLSVLDCAWVNRKETISRISSNKLYQQRVALRCGLSVPKTLISNSPESVQAFSREKGGLLVKTLGQTKLDEADEFFLYSERFSCEELEKSATAIQACPLFAQHYVEKRYEYRVMVIGTEVLACRIASQASPMTKTDWRHYDFENVEHVRAELPSIVRKRLLQFMEEIGLTYGAIDLIETPEGNYVFLEVNPSGQWGWIEHYADLGIPQAVAEMLWVL